MRFTILYIILFCLGNCISAQIVKKESGRITCDNTYICNYIQTGTPIPILDINVNCTGNLTLPEHEHFKDYIFTSENGEQLIYATATVLSSPYYKFLRYCYKIDFLFADTNMYLTYQYSIVDNFLKSVSKHMVINNGITDKNNVNALINFWQKNNGAIDPKYIAVGNTCHYNTSPYNVEETYDTAYTVKGNNIYKNGFLIGNYKKSWKLQRYHQSPSGGYYYVIQDIAGNHVGEVEIYHQFGDIWIWPPGMKNYLSMFSPVREEPKVIALATKFLLAYNSEQLAKVKQ